MKELDRQLLEGIASDQDVRGVGVDRVTAVPQPQVVEHVRLTQVHELFVAIARKLPKASSLQRNGQQGIVIAQNQGTPEAKRGCCSTTAPEDEDNGPKKKPVPVYRWTLSESTGVGYAIT